MDEKDQNFERDKFLLDLMIHKYDEDVQRNELIDSKNSQMIVILGVMITLQSTFFIQLLVDRILLNCQVSLIWKIFLSIVMVISLVFYTIALYFFIDAYAFCDEFSSAPKSSFLIKKAKSDEDEFDIRKVILANFNKVIEENNKIIETKAVKGKKGFKFFKISCAVTVVFLCIFLFVLFFHII